MDWSKLLSSPWRTYDPSRASHWDLVYRSFNLFEAVCWLLLAGLVWSRWRRNRASPLELVYALLFFLFGLTDIREAWEQSLPLVIVKGVILGFLLFVRRHVMRTAYPQARLY